MSITSTLVRLSRLPVGSSARKDRGIVRERAGNRHTLLAGPPESLIGVMLSTFGEAPRRRARPGRVYAVSDADTVVCTVEAKAVFDIFHSGGTGQQIESLKDKADFPVANP